MDSPREPASNDPSVPSAMNPRVGEEPTAQERTLESGGIRYSGWVTVGVFLLGAIVAGGTVAGPGLSWDEPAYRHSQVTLQQWFYKLYGAKGYFEFVYLLAPDAIEAHWEYNRFGHNFHPPMGGLLNLVTYGLLHQYWDDISSRRLASALEFAGTVAILCHFLGRRYGTSVGVFSGLSLLTMPRLMGDAHVIGTDMPLLFFWSAAALAFYRALSSRAWQWGFAFLAACLFLVKFTGAFVMAPCLAWFVCGVLFRQRATNWIRWLFWSILMAAPLLPIGITLWVGPNPDPSEFQSPILLDIAAMGLAYSKTTALLFFAPLCMFIFFQFLRREEESSEWSVALELPWVVMAATPLVCVVLNPTWWHDPVRSLANYFAITLNRQGVLPPIEIFYLGEKHLYSLPWHNAFVLMAVTIPFGTLALGILGTLRALVVVRRDLIPLYFVLQMLALPIFRMFPTPAHDGVRLFLPTFFFFAGLAGLAAGWLARLAVQRWPGFSKLAWSLLFLIGPIWSGFDWIRVHPFELSYYNIGLARAFDGGFEADYWYDAVTPTVVEDLNRLLPEEAVFSFPDPLINPETFALLQQLGRLRKGIGVELSSPDAFPWYWLLTQSSKATSFTRLLYACPPWYESGHAGVRLFSVVDPKRAAVAWALHALTVEKDAKPTPSASGDQPNPSPLKLREAVFAANPDSLARAIDLLSLRTKNPNIPLHLSQEPPEVRKLAAMFMQVGRVDPNLAKVMKSEPEALSTALKILANRPADVRKVLESPGYLKPERFGGYFEVTEEGTFGPGAPREVRYE
ncbi:MAG: glycosyltransferase family 39 protein [Planctomycetota bacterium]